MVVFCPSGGTSSPSSRGSSNLVLVTRRYSSTHYHPSGKEIRFVLLIRSLKCTNATIKFFIPLAGSGVSEHPTIQLVLYIPPCQISPLFITSSRPTIQPSLAFLSPRWGGVQIVNPPQNLCGHADEKSSWLDSETIMNTFKMQLKLLVGFPELVSLLLVCT